MRLKQYLYLGILLSFSLPLVLDARARMKSWREINGNNWLVLQYNGRIEKFLDWTDEAKHFWETGQLPSEQNIADQSEIYEALESHRKAILRLQRIVDQQKVTIKELHTKIDEIEESAIAASSLQVWTDSEGSSFVGSFVKYELGRVYVKKYSDSMVYDIQKSRLSPVCQELALALNQITKAE